MGTASPSKGAERRLLPTRSLPELPCEGAEAEADLRGSLPRSRCASCTDAALGTHLREEILQGLFRLPPRSWDAPGAGSRPGWSRTLGIRLEMRHSEVFPLYRSPDPQRVAASRR